MAIKNLKLKLKSSLLSELQSDTIFGHFAWRLKDKFGDEKLTEFLKFFKDGNPIFTISDGIFENVKEKNLFFPKPLKLTPPIFEKTVKKERIKNFLKQKESKSRKFITLDELNLYLKGSFIDFEKLIELNNNLTFPKYEQDLRISVEIDRNTNKSQDGKLFSYNPKYLKDDIVINIFVKVLNENLWHEFKCEDVLYDVFEIGYGKKKSSGYGQFEVLSDIVDFNGFDEPKNSDGFYTLSNYLPSNEDGIKEAFYDINVKYGKLGEEYSQSQNPFKPPILLMKPGSCFKTNVKKEFYGRTVDNLIDYKPNVLHNGIAFSLKCKFN